MKTSRHLKAAGFTGEVLANAIKAGMVMHIGHWMQFLNSKVEAVSDTGDWRKPMLTLTLEKDLVYRRGDKAVLMYLEGGKLRVAGTVDLA